MKKKNSSSLNRILAVLRKHEPELRQTYGAAGIWVFGSYVRGEQSARSDIDLLVRFEPGRKTFDNYMGLKFRLEEILGRKVDLITRESIRKEIREQVYAEAVNV